MKVFKINIELKREYFLLGLFCFVFPLSTAYAGANIDFNVMMSALKSNAVPIIKLTTAVGYVLGFWLMVSGIQELKKIGNSQGAMTQGVGTLGGPLVRLLIGAALIYLPSTINVSLMTLWGNTSIIEYKAAGDKFADVKEGAAMLVEAIGYISFVRGFVILANSTKQGGQQGTVGKGIVHIIGGILAINIGGTINIIKSSLGFVTG